MNRRYRLERAQSAGHIPKGRLQIVAIGKALMTESDKMF